MQRVRDEKTASGPKSPHRKAYSGRARVLPLATGAENDFLTPFLGRNTSRISSSNTRQENRSSIQLRRFIEPWGRIQLLSLSLAILVLFMLVFANSHSSGMIMGGQSFRVEFARTGPEKALGLSNRGSLPKNNAMLFVFNKPDTQCFWMKDMHFPLDIIWLDANQNIVFIENNLSPSSYPSVYCSNNTAKYVIEVNANTASKLKLAIGSHVIF